jgi:hypothetical protein
MTTALAITVRDPQQCYSGFLSLMARLTGQLGVTVAYVPLGDRLGRWDGPTNTVLIDRYACLEDQMWLLNQVWLLLATGPSAIDVAATRDPRLTLVPTPRVSLSNLA